MAIRQFAQMSLVLAGEHLRLALDAIKAKHLYPSSHVTAWRTGRRIPAVWIPGHEDRGQRRERALTVLAERYIQMGNAMASSLAPSSMATIARGT